MKGMWKVVNFIRIAIALIIVFGLLAGVLILIGLNMTFTADNDYRMLLSGMGLVLGATLIVNGIFKAFGYFLVYAKKEMRQWWHSTHPELGNEFNFVADITVNVMITFVLVSAIQTLSASVISWMNGLWLGIPFLGFIAYLILLIFVPRFFNSYLLGNAYHQYREHVSKEKTSFKDKHENHQAIYGELIIPLKAVTTKAPSVVYNKYFEENYKTDTIKMQGDTIIDIVNIKDVDQPKVTLLKAQYDFGIDLQMDNGKSVLKIMINTPGNIDITSKEANYRIQKKNVLSRDITVYKDDEIYVTTKVERHEGKKVIYIRLYNEDNPGVSIGLVYGAIYGLMM